MFYPASEKPIITKHIYQSDFEACLKQPVRMKDNFANFYKPAQYWIIKC